MWSRDAFAEADCRIRRQRHIRSAVPKIFDSACSRMQPNKILCVEKGRNIARDVAQGPQISVAMSAVVQPGAIS